MGEINPFPGPHTLLRIPNKMVGLIIGKNGETVKTIHQKTGCYIFIPKDSKPGEDYRELELSGPAQSVEICKREIISMIHMVNLFLLFFYSYLRLYMEDYLTRILYFILILTLLLDCR